MANLQNQISFTSTISTTREGLAPGEPSTKRSDIACPKTSAGLIGRRKSSCPLLPTQKIAAARPNLSVPLRHITPPSYQALHRPLPHPPPQSSLPPSKPITRSSRR